MSDLPCPHCGAAHQCEAIPEARGLLRSRCEVCGGEAIVERDRAHTPQALAQLYAWDGDEGVVIGDRWRSMVCRDDAG